jgi:predicted nucleic acid-binding protein
MLVLDSEGVSRLILRDRAMTALVKGLTEDGQAVVASAVTLVEGINPAMSSAAVRRAASGFQTEAVTRQTALVATDLLRAARRHGHRHAIDAIVCATAVLAGEPQVAILTSDPDDLRALLADHVGIAILPAADL